jgi:superfamily II DNA/RNA helicase
LFSLSLSPFPLLLFVSGSPSGGEDTAIYETSEEVKPVTSFDSMGLKEELLQGLYSFGFEKPSAIQQRAIMPIIKGPRALFLSRSY